MTLKAPLAAAMAAVLLLFAAPAAALHEGLYTYPDIHGDTIIFVSEGNLWSVPAEGGVATRLTTGWATVMMPRISPDGRWIAFTSSHDRNNDIHVMPIEGGPTERLTWHPGGDFMAEWSPDSGTIFFYNSYEGPFSLPYLRAVPRTGGFARRVPVGHASNFAMHADGDLVAFNRLIGFWRTWKRYMGGTTDAITIGRLSTGEFRTVTTFPGHDSEPMWVGDRIFFTSERDGRMNLWSLDKDGGDLRQHTFHDDFDVRRANSDYTHRVIYQHGADLRVYDARTGGDTLVPIQIRTDRRETVDRFVWSSQNIESIDLSPTGQRVLATVRGDIWNIPAKNGLARHVANTPGVREREARFAGKDGEWMLYWSDKTGEEHLHRASAVTGEDEECLTCGVTGESAWRFPVEVSPCGLRIAWGDHTGKLFWASLEGDFEPVLVDDSDRWETTQYAWSPDSRYLAYTLYDGDNWFSRVFVYDTEEHETRPVTDPMYSSGWPAWDPDGKYLFYVSSRSFDPIFDAYDWNAGLLSMSAIYAVLLADDTRDPFFPKDYYEEKAREEAEKAREEEEAEADEEEEPESEDEESEEEEAEGGDEEKEDEESESKPDPVRIDWDGILRRQVEVRGVEQETIVALGAAKGRLYYMSARELGRLGRFGQSITAQDPRLMTIEFGKEDAKPSLFVANTSGYTLSRDRSRIAVRHAGGLHVADTGGSFSADSADRPPINDIRVRVSPPREWAQIYDELFRLYRDFFYTADMGGTDWAAEHARYRQLLPRISTRLELADLMREAVGELGTSHTYIGVPDDIPRTMGITTALLGADLDYDDEAGAFYFERIYKGNAWDGNERVILGAVHTGVQEGDYLLAIDGVPLRVDVDPYSLLYNKAGMQVRLTVNSKPAMEGARDIRVDTLATDAHLRYRDWVDRNRAYVAEKSGGKLIYVHIPDMSPRGLVEFFRQWTPQLSRDAQGLVVDVRFNGGGNVSSIIIERLRRVLYAMTNVRNFDDFTYPRNVFVGRMAVLVNESAGSDGDIFTESFRAFDLGPVIGTTSWGGTVGIRGGKLHVDESQTMIPEYGFWEPIRGFDIENEGVVPDIVIDNTPMDNIAGRDAQLDKAIEVVLELVRTNPVEFPEKPAPGGNSLERFRQRAAPWMDKP